MIKKKYYYSNKRVLRINVRHSQLRTKLTPDSIYINGILVSSWALDSSYNCIIENVPSSFTIIVKKLNYWDGGGSYTFDELDTGDVFLTPEQAGTFNMNIHWDPPEGTAYDIDAHLLILDSSDMSLKGHLSYLSNGGSGEGYAYSKVVDDIRYKLNYDADPRANWGSSYTPSEDDPNHTENLMGEVRPVPEGATHSGRIYRFIVEDYKFPDSGGHMADVNCTATISFNGSKQYKVRDISLNNYHYWIVCLLVEVLDENNNYVWVLQDGSSIKPSTYYSNTDPYSAPY